MGIGGAATVPPVRAAAAAAIQVPSPPAAPAAPVADPSAGGSAATGGSFAQILGQAIRSLDGLQNQADAAAQALASGSGTDLATAVMAAEKANLALQLAVEVRNRAIGAYQQLMQLQV